MRDIRPMKISSLKSFLFWNKLISSIMNVILLFLGREPLTISELCIVGKPSILIPSPNVSENHQFYNAKYLHDRNAVIMIEEKKVNKDFLVHLENLLLSKEIRRKLTTGICKLAKPDATKDVVQEINKILENG